MLTNEPWYRFLDEKMRQLVDESFYLLDREEMGGEGLADYGFIVFPMAKAYEGFVKKFLFHTGLIDQKALESKRFRVGKSLNPGLNPESRDDWWVYERLDKRCGEVNGVRVVKVMWRAWKWGRNRLFHYFFSQPRLIDLETARKRVDLLAGAMRLAVSCGVVENDSR